MIFQGSTSLEHGVADEGGDRSGDVGGGNERHDGDHGEAAVVELSILLLLEGGRIDAGEVDGGEDDGGEVSTLGVVGSVGLGDDLGKEDGEVDLGLAGVGDGSPGIQGLHGRKGLERDAVGGGEHAGEVAPGGLDQVPGGGEHGDAGVLELGRAEPGEGGLGSEGGEVQGVELGEGGGGAGHVIDGKADRGGGAAELGRGEGGGGAGEGEEGGGDFHGWQEKDLG
mmetsp:Transcript_37589/g.76678  ORF Transcript_37589/g.76678 Transcript_37589/m.76678 type:complete len:225 (-) Transcript_37589:72-746(-)